MSYRLRYSDEAKGALRNAPGQYRQRFRRAIDGLAGDPQPGNAEPMRQPGYYKIKFDRWRLIYRVREDLGEVRILRIGVKTGPETYEDLEEHRSGLSKHSA